MSATTPATASSPTRPSASPLIWLIACVLLAAAAVARADIIYFKDGFRTVCRQRAWEEKDEVKCEYDGIVLTYRLADVDHIRKTIAAPPRKGGPNAPPLPPAGFSALPSSQLAAPRKAVTGPLFYDPRRPYEYWSSPTAKHHTYEEAVAALAEEFGRPVEWVQSHMGDTNDLGQIRRNLGETPSTPPAPAEKTAAPPPDVPAERQFYNPRRQYKYHIGPAMRYRTYQEAIDALAREFGRRPQWVEEHMGEENDWLAIRRRLEDKQNQAPARGRPDGGHGR